MKVMAISNGGRVGRRGFMLGAAAATAAPVVLRSARAQTTAGPLRIGVLGDFSGPYSAISGEGSAVAAGLAIADFGGTVLGRPIELVTADHLNKPDVGLSIVREWFGPGDVAMITDGTNSAIALGIQPLLTEHHRIALYTTVGNSDLIGRACSPLSAVWAHDTWSNVVSPIRALMASGVDTFYLIAADYAFGKTLETDATNTIVAGNGKVLGTARHPINSSDFSSYLLTAQASGAQAVMLLNGGLDFVNCFKQAVEFELPKKQAIIAPIVFLSDIHSLGLPLAQGLQFAQSWYWDLNDTTRAWSKRFYDLRKRMPDDTHAATYSAVLEYLRAVERAKTDTAEQVMAELKSMTVSDAFTPNGHVRADGKMVFDRYLVRVKRPEESRGPWDYLSIVSKVSAADAFRPLADSVCPFVKA
jgi:branched-chain amino acid transport system substrate-binding protein